jgi:hypothetical protein
MVMHSFDAMRAAPAAGLIGFCVGRDFKATLVLKNRNCSGRIFHGPS